MNDCYECCAPLVGPFCPECNPAIKRALGFKTDQEETRQAIEAIRKFEIYGHGIWNVGRALNILLKSASITEPTTNKETQ